MEMNYGFPIYDDDDGWMDGQVKKYTSIQFILFIYIFTTHKKIVMYVN